MSAVKCRRLLVVCLWQMLSVVLPIGLVFLACMAALWNKPFGNESNEIALYDRGSVKDGELWYPVREALPYFHAKRFRFKRLNLETGVEHETGLAVEGDFWPFVARVSDTLYFNNRASIYRIVGTKAEPLGPARPDAQLIASAPFLYAGELTLIEARADGPHRLSHWRGGTWSSGREILLPGFDRTWYDDPQRQRKVLLPRPNFQSPPGRVRGWGADPSWVDIRLIPRDDDFYLFVDLPGQRGFYAYRKGFEFIDKSPDTPSALGPENAPHDVSGWQAVPFLDADSESNRWVEMAADHHSLIFLVNRYEGVSIKLVRLYSDGHCKGLLNRDLSPAADDQYRWANLVLDPQDGSAYLIRKSNYWRSVSIQRIDASEVQAPHVNLKGSEREYLCRWMIIVLGLVLAWLSHAGVLAMGADRQSLVADEIYAFGLERVVLASMTRRMMARLIDGLFVFAVFSLLYWLLFRDRFSQIRWPSEERLATFLYMWEYELATELVWPGMTVRKFFTGRWIRRALAPISGSSMGRFFDSLPYNSEFLVVAILTLLTLQASLLYLESRCGITPGKWLMGIRTIRATLRPHGFGRAIVRDAMLCFDVPLLLTPLPAAVSLLFSERRQRLGDRVADTIVIRHLPKIKSIDVGALPGLVSDQ